MRTHDGAVGQACLDLHCDEFFAGFRFQCGLVNIFSFGSIERNDENCSFAAARESA
jgi:hypothetical protein